jgi:hypothetical protein
VLRSMKARLAIVVTAAALSVGAVAAPAASAQPVVTGGLVNVTVTDVLNNNQVSVQVPVGVAANVCGVAANVLATGNRQASHDCTSSTTQDLPVAFRP